MYTSNSIDHVSRSTANVRSPYVQVLIVDNIKKIYLPNVFSYLIKPVEDIAKKRLRAKGSATWLEKSNLCAILLRAQYASDLREVLYPACIFDVRQCPWDVRGIVTVFVSFNEKKNLKCTFNIVTSAWFYFFMALALNSCGYS